MALLKLVVAVEKKSLTKKIETNQFASRVSLINSKYRVSDFHFSLFESL